MVFIAVNKQRNKDMHVTEADMDDAIRDLLKTENYTVNVQFVEAMVRSFYLYAVDPRNATMRREQFVNVSALKKRLQTCGVSFFAFKCQTWKK